LLLKHNQVSRQLSSNIDLDVRILSRPIVSIFYSLDVCTGNQQIVPANSAIMNNVGFLISLTVRVAQIRLAEVGYASGHETSDCGWAVTRRKGCRCGGSVRQIPVNSQ
jgi:hypothetical protein